MLRNALNILESLTKIRIIVFRRVWVHIIFNKNISNPGFLSKDNRNYSGIQLIDITCYFLDDLVIPEFLQT